MDKTIEQRLKEMMVQRLFMKVGPEQIEDDKSLISHYGVDSLNLLELVVGVEEEFGIQVGDNEFRVANFESVKALADFVRKRLG